MTNELQRERYADFYRLAGDLQSGNIDFSDCRGSDDPELNVEKLIAEVPIDDANSVSSRIKDDVFGFHKVVIDLDMDAALIPSTTPGHHHLIIDRALPWPAYKRLLEALKDAGLIEEGFYRAAVERGASWVRTPWTKKEQPKA